MTAAAVMNLTEADAGHPREVTVEGPDRCVLAGRNGGDQEIREAETLSSGPRAIEPFVDSDPRLLGRKEKWKRSRSVRTFR